MSKTKAPACPKCGSTEVLEIVYGLPTAALFEEAERGEVALGGCVLFGEDPKWSCQGCGFEFPPYPLQTQRLLDGEDPPDKEMQDE